MLKKFKLKLELIKREDILREIIPSPFNKDPELKYVWNLRLFLFSIVHKFLESKKLKKVNKL